MRTAVLRTRSLRTIGIVATAAIAFAGLNIQSMPAATAQVLSAPAKLQSVDGSSAKPVAVRPQKSTSRPSKAPVPVKAGDYELEVSASGPTSAIDGAVTKSGSKVISDEWTKIGSTGISLAAAQTAKQWSGARSLVEPTPGPGLRETNVLGVRTIGGSELANLGGAGFAMEITSGVPDQIVAVKFPDKLLSKFGANFVERLTWSQVSTDGSKKKVVTPLTPVHDSDLKSVVVTPQVGTASTTLIATAAAVSASGAGNYAATPYNPASTWDVSAQTGSFAWSVPMKVPPVAAGVTPSLSMNYNSQAVDGLTSATNNQSSEVGEGWALSGSGYIQRSFVSCAKDKDDPQELSGDLCWKNDNVSLSFGSHSGQLVKDEVSGQWKLQGDDGTKITQLTGSSGCVNGDNANVCWLITTTDGTKYYFGKHRLPGYSTSTPSSTPATNSVWTVPVFGNSTGEPCHGTSFALSSCTQAWRWNLDYAVDRFGNAEALYYAAQTNKYQRNGTTSTTYTRGGRLMKIEYGIAGPSALPYSANAAGGKAVFTYDQYGRCNDFNTSTRASNCFAESGATPALISSKGFRYPDVPYDQFCAATCAALISPTFWSTSRLSSVSTSVFQGGTWKPADTWTLEHDFPSTGDSGDPSMWLKSVVHSGATTATADPKELFTPISLPNMVDNEGGNLYLRKQRLASIDTATGARIAVNYSDSACDVSDASEVIADEQNNDKLCFPQWWYKTSTGSADPVESVFQKYVVESVISDPRTGGVYDEPSVVTYDYSAGTPRWRYESSLFTPKNLRTWSIFAGFDKVSVLQGSTASERKKSTYTYFQGKDKDHSSDRVWMDDGHTLADSAWFSGKVRTVEKFADESDTVPLEIQTTTPLAAVTATPDSDDVLNVANSSAYMVRDAHSVRKLLQSDGSFKTIERTVAFNSNGFPTSEESKSTDVGDQCTTTTYNPVTTSGVVDLPREVLTVAKACNTAITYPDDVVSHTRTLYDNKLPGEVAPIGNVTEVDVVKTYTNGTPVWHPQSRKTYDTRGRVLTEKDAADAVVTFAYSAGSATVNPSVSSINALGWTTKVFYDPRWGVTTSEIDANDKVVTATYDGLGRRVGVWLPNRPYSTTTTPSLQYTYSTPTVNGLAAGPNSIETSTIAPQSVLKTYELFDGLGRLVQSQGAAVGGGAIVSDLGYDSQGNVNHTNDAYWSQSVSPSGALFVPANQAQIPSQMQITFDGRGGPVERTLRSYGVDKGTTTTLHVGSDRTDVIPPEGGTAYSTFENSAGKQVANIQYLDGVVPSSPVIETSSTQVATTYEYDARGSMTSMTDPDGNEWNWTFNLLGELASASDPDGGLSTTTYDLVGNIQSVTDSRGKKVVFEYDALGRRTGVFQAAGGASGTKVAAWTYDTVAGAKGQIASAISYVGSQPGTLGLAYTQKITGYDAMYNVTSTQFTIPTTAPHFGGTDYKASYTYNSAAVPATISLPAVGTLPAETIRPTYDAYGNLSGLGGSVPYADLAYNPLGQRSAIRRTSTGKSLESLFGYDPATGALIQVQDRWKVGTTTEVLSDRGYAYDAVGNVTSMTLAGDQLQTERECYTYDSLRNLSEAWTSSSSTCASQPTSGEVGGPNPYWTTYLVSPRTGNRLAVTEHAVGALSNDVVNSYRYPSPGQAHPHGVSFIEVSNGVDSDESSFTYDEAGNTLTSSGREIAYDYLGRMSTVEVSDAVISNIYSPTGELLVQADSDAGATLYLGGTEVHEATDGVRTATRRYLVDDVAVAERVTNVSGTGTSLTWLAADLQGSIQLRVDPATGVATRRAADPFGVPRDVQGSWVSGRGYLDAPANNNTGLTQLGNRAYDPALGRFLALDPVVSPLNPQQSAGYSYAANNPMSYVDPTGNCYFGVNGDHYYSGACDEGLTDGGFDEQNVTETPVSKDPVVRISYNCGFDPNCYSPAYAEAHMDDLVAYERGMQALRDEPFDKNPGKYLNRLADAAEEVTAPLAATCMADFAQPLCWFGAAGIGSKALRGSGALAEIGAASTASKVVTGGAAPVRAGQNGEAAVRSVFAIGDREYYKVGGRNRISDGSTAMELSEVKNVKYQAYTQQIKDAVEWAGEGRQVVLYVRPATASQEGTVLSRQLLEAIDNGFVKLRMIPIE